MLNGREVRNVEARREQEELRQTEEIPDFVIDTMARCILPKMLEFFASEEGQAEYARWNAEHKSDCE